jgi:sec-independent protein translocase protein TatB
VFGLSFGELVMVLIVAMVVLGPKDLPRYLRKAGQLAGRLRRMAFEMREKSGIDELLRSEGIDRDIAEIRKLTRGELAGVVAAIRSTSSAVVADDAPLNPYVEARPLPADITILREREYPRDGADAYGAIPDTAAVYEGALAPSPLADDALYARGEAPDAAPRTAQSATRPQVSTAGR